MLRFSTEIIVSTHANPAALDLCLLALSRQGLGGFGVCVAEDGRDGETAAVVSRRAGDFGGGLRHVTQPHEGFRKNRILNAAIGSSRADYLLFVDGDCLAAPAFAARHVNLAREGRFVTGGVVRLPEEIGRGLTAEQVGRGEVFGWPWLRSRGVGGLRPYLKSGALPGWASSVLERLTPVEPTWNGGNSSGWRKDLVAVNGFDESLGYGGEDVEMGFRLNRLGVKGRHARYSAVLLHLPHPRPYMDPAQRDASIERVWQRRHTVPIRAEKGISPS